MNPFDTIRTDLKALADTAPVIHNITNFVVMNSTANALLAVGASPIMAHAPEEMRDIVTLAHALVLNIGTLSTPWVESMKTALETARDRKIPVVLDPVGAGASRLRTRTAHDMLAAGGVTILRANAAEVRALCDAQAGTRGVDSHLASDAALDNAHALSTRFRCTVVISGAVDRIVSEEKRAEVHLGHPMMTRVTGMGCTASALVGAFAAVNPDAVSAAAHAMTLMGLAGEKAAAASNGPGSFQVAFIDALYSTARQA